MKSLSTLFLLPALTTTSLFLASMTTNRCWWTSLNFRSKWFKSSSGNSLEPEDEHHSKMEIPQSHHSLMVNAARHYTFKNYAAALGNYRRVLADNPGDRAALSGEAWCLYYMGQEEQAAKDFAALLKFDISDSWAQEGMALCGHKHSI